MVTRLSQSVYYLEARVATTQVISTLRSKGSHELIYLLFVTRALLENGLAVRLLIVLHVYTGAPLLYSSGAPKSGAPLVFNYQWCTSAVVGHY
jgi:hypothetical protein